MRFAAPGLMRREVNPEVLMMVCTAGHVDHGKTALVQLLTGCRTDRLKAEQERGLTIELGFAPCFLGGNECVGIVDVPGHEKFVRTMVAGVSGIDSTILVIAADDGIMPQTVEHLQIMDLLGVRNGIVALTKIDLVPEFRVREVTESIRTFLKGTFLEGSPICPVSSETFEGYPEFYDTLVSHIRALGKRRRSGVFRMPIERTFRKEGFGIVVTGIPVDGEVHVGDTVEFVPGGDRAKVRGIQRFLRDAREGGFGQCLALNLSEGGRTAPLRGMVVARPGILKPASIFHVRITTVPSLETPLRHAETIKFHTGTSEQTGKVYLLEGRALGPGEVGLTTIVLNEPVAAAPHDRCILRRSSPANTIAGGEILRPCLDAQRPKKQQILPILLEYGERLQGIDPSGPEGLKTRAELFLLHDHPKGASLESIAANLFLADATARLILDDLALQGAVLHLGRASDTESGDFYVHQDRYREVLGFLERRIAQACEQGNVSLSVADLIAGESLPVPIWARLRSDLENTGKAAIQGNRVILLGAGERFTPEERKHLDRIQEIYESTAFQSPRPEEVRDQLRLSPQSFDRLFEYLYRSGQLVRLTPNVVLSRAAFQRAQSLVVDAIRKNGLLDSADFKHHIQSSRKYALAILDTLDARRVTLRVGNVRKLAPEYERNLL